MTLWARAERDRYFVHLDGLRIRVFSHDGRCDEAGPAVVLIHGAGGNYLQWPPEIRRMPGMLVVALDLPGHGDSAGEGFSDISSYAAFVSALVEELDLAEVVAVGHSMGAAIALEFPCLAKELVTGIGVLAAGDRYCVPDDLIELICTDSEAATRRIAEASFGPDTPAKMRSLYLRRLRDTDPEILYADFVAISMFDAYQFAGSLNVPALVVAGSQDKLVPPSASLALHEQIPDSHLHILEGAGHMFLWERTEEVRQLITDLAERVTHR